MKVEIGNSVCRISDFSIGQFGELRKLMSYVETTKLRYHRHFGSIRRYLIGKRGDFPTGLLYILEDWAVKTNTSLEVVDTRIIPKDRNTRKVGRDSMFVRKDFESYVEQLEAAQAAVKSGRGIITAPTGFGKSVIVAEIIEALLTPTLVVVPSLGLKRQLTKNLRQMFGDKLVGPLIDKKQHYFVTVENVDALDPKKAIEGFDCVIIDEFHRSGAKTYRELNKKSWSGIYYKFGLTATPFRNKSEERLLLESVLSKVIYEIPYELAVAKGYIVPLEAYYIDLPEIKMKGSENSWKSVYSELIVKNADLNELAARLMASLHSSGLSCLALVKEIKHGADIQARVARRYGFDIPFAKGENDDNEDVLNSFNDTSECSLIGTEGVMGEGVDTKPCEWILDIGGGKSKNRFMQKAGRAFRKYCHPKTGQKESCKLVLFRYAHNKFLKKHFAICKKILKEEYGIVPVQLHL